MADDTAPVVHCRLPPETLRALDARVAELKAKGLDGRLATRSSVLRSLLGLQLGVGKHTLIEFEVLEAAQHVIDSIRQRLTAKLAQLPSTPREAAELVSTALSAEG